tara:strand:+ start:825 stop:1565 length:741 start_codon:yes stop_codon:yes gene_type:complete
MLSRMINKQLDIYCSCISTNRPDNVRDLEDKTGIKFTYYTKQGETEAYVKGGASKVVEVDGNICMARNKAIDDAKGKVCLQMSDDFKKVSLVRGGNGVYNKEIVTFVEALKIMVEGFRKIEGSYAGTAITDNIFYYTGKQVQQNKLIVNDCILLDGKMKFDEKADLKEDYDMFITQVKAGNKVLRFNLILMTFPHRGNKGGANDYRTTEREKKCNEYVLRKHYGILRPHSRRENQLEINYKELFKK